MAHDCGDCGESDLHGSLFLVSKREWGSDDNDVNGNGRGTNKNNSNSNRNGDDNRKVVVIATVIEVVVGVEEGEPLLLRLSND